MRFVVTVLSLALIALVAPTLGLQRHLERIQQDRVAARKSELKVLGGLLDEHVSSHWELLDRDLVNPHEDKLSFSIQLKQCNLLELKELLDQVSNPKHPNYQDYRTSEQLDEAVSCGAPTEKAKQDIPNWLESNGIQKSQIFVNNAYIRVEKASVSQLERLFDVQMMYHQHKLSGKKLLRARGLLTMPAAIGEHALFITGLTELYAPSKAATRMSLERMRSRQEGIATYFSDDYEDPPISPRLLRRLYNVRANLTGGSASNNSLAIAAFDDFFYEDDLCYAADMFGRDPTDDSLYVVPNVDYHGPEDGSDNGESSLDIQFATALAPNVSASFWGHDAEDWVLTWAQQAVNITTNNGPWIWSVSYGMPEVAHCAHVNDSTDRNLCGDLDLDFRGYIELTNVEFMKLALMGVTVFVSSGDDGAPGNGIYCPVDASKPQAFKENVDQVYTCPSNDPTDCKCGSFVLEYVKENKTIPCFLPQALPGDEINGQIGGLTSCTLIDKKDKPIMKELAKVMQLWVQDMNGTCLSAYDSATFTFGSTCSCSELPSFSTEFVIPSTNETIQVNLSAYAFNTSYALSIFYSDFPTSSPYVISVGATQIDPYAGSNSCGQSPKEILAQPWTGALITGGGGFASASARPSWQADMVETYLKTNELPPSAWFNSTNRGYPDLSLNGHNFPVMVNGQIGNYDGTSASSPSLAALFALMNEVLLTHGKKPLGLLAPLLYQIALEEPTAFTKISPITVGNRTVGGDNACTSMYCCQYGYKVSESGWDPVTGLGTPNMLVIENYIRKLNGLPTVAEEGAAQSSNTPPTNSTGQAFSNNDTPRTVTTAGAVVMIVVSGILGMMGTIIFMKARASGLTTDKNDAYQRQQSL